jgi:hypothetical protein
MTVKGVIFDYKALLGLQPGSAATSEVRDILVWLRFQGLRWCLFSTDSLSTSQVAAFSALGYPPPDVYIRKADIPSGKNRGSPDWIDVVTTRLGVVRQELLYVGCTALDWRTAINSGVFYVHARWAAPMPSGTTSLTAESPSWIREFLEFFLLHPPRWSHSLNGTDYTLRSLLPASALLPCTSPGQEFKLQDVFTRERSIRIANNDARDILMLFVLANAYMEGLLPANLYLCVYPSSRRGTISEQLRGYLDPAAALVHGYYRDDLLIRASDAPDSSLSRWEASQTGRPANISIATQATTVHLGPDYQFKLQGKTVIVFDDFTTKGMSLEWARLLLTAAGAGRIVLITVGKYGTTHTRYELAPGVQVDPYGQNTTLTRADFTERSLTPYVDQGASGYYSNIITQIIVASRHGAPNS